MKFKILALIVLVCSSSVFSQSDEALAAKDFFWGKTDAYKNKTELPEKWSNESAVILYKNENYDFHFMSRSRLCSISTVESASPRPPPLAPTVPARTSAGR